MRWIETIHVENPLVGKTWDIDLRAEERPRHLILTGPNGVGKTSTLMKILRNEMGALSDRTQLWRECTNSETGKVSGVRPSQVRPPESEILAFFGAQRKLEPRKSEGPKIDSPQNPTSPDINYHAEILQFMVNYRTQQAYAREEGDAKSVERVVRWFERVEVFFRSLFDDVGLELVFVRKEFRFDLKFGDGRVRKLHELPAGFSSFMVIVADLLVREAEVRAAQPGLDRDVEGVVFIDEIDAHLHIELQERALPMLAGLFPGIQWVVTTHAPAVLGSLPHALVFDLGTGVGTPSEDFIGVRFGSIVTSHFGLPTDLDRDSTEKLQRLDTLLSGPITAESRQEVIALSALLSARSPALSMEVWARTRAQVVEGATAAR